MPRDVTLRLIVLSPCGFIATNYMILGRLARHLDHGEYLFISPMRVTMIFVLSDVSTFLIQAAGGGISTGNSHNAVTLGSHVSSIFNHISVVVDSYAQLLALRCWLGDTIGLVFTLHLPLPHVPLSRSLKVT